MRIPALLLFTVSAAGLLGFRADYDRIVPGDRLEVKFWGPNLGGTELRVVQSNGTIRLGDSTLLHVQGKTTDEAGRSLSAALYVSTGRTNAIRGGSVRKIAPIPDPIAMSVSQLDDSNVVFRLTNVTTNSIRL